MKEDGRSRAEVLILMQLLNAMKEIAEKMDVFYRKNDMEKFEEAKRELILLQEKIAKIL